MRNGYNAIVLLVVCKEKGQTDSFIPKIPILQKRRGSWQFAAHTAAVTAVAIIIMHHYYYHYIWYWIEWCSSLLITIQQHFLGRRENPLLLVWEWCTHEIGRERREWRSSENITVFHLVAIQMPRHSHTETIIISVGISIKDIKQKAVRIIKFRLAGVACCRHSNCISCLLCFLLLVELHYISHTLDD